MSLISSGIEKVRAYQLPLGIAADGSVFSGPRTAVIKWRSSWQDKCYQVYVNGKFAGTTTDTEQRKMVVQVPGSFEAPVRVEVFAVAPADSGTDFSEDLALEAESGRVKLRFLRGQNLPIDSVVEIYSDNGSGQIDYQTVLSDSRTRVWPSWQDKSGLGMSRFGYSDFGYDSAAAVGFGKGVFGQSEFGIDTDMFEWVSEQLAAGVYKFAVKITDGAGNESAAEEAELTVISAAKPASKLGTSSFDKNTNQLSLKIQ